MKIGVFTGATEYETKIEKPISHLLIKITNATGVQVPNPKLTLVLNKKDGQELTLFNMLPLNVLAFLSQVGEGTNRNYYTDGKLLESRQVIECGYDGAIALDDNENLRFKIFGANATDKIEVFGLELGELTSQIYRYKIFDLDSAVDDKPLNVSKYTGLCIDEAILTEMRGAYDSGKTFNVSTEELKIQQQFFNDAALIERYYDSTAGTFSTEILNYPDGLLYIPTVSNEANVEKVFITTNTSGDLFAVMIEDIDEKELEKGNVTKRHLEVAASKNQIDKEVVKNAPKTIKIQSLPRIIKPNFRTI